MLDSLYQSSVMFFVAVCAYAGSDVGVWEFGTTIISSCLITMLLHCAMEIRSWVSRLKLDNLVNVIKLVFI
jgi:phospholipid-translocating ATPase